MRFSVRPVNHNPSEKSYRKAVIISLLALLSTSGCTLTQKIADLPVVAVRSAINGFTSEKSVDLVALQSDLLRFSDTFILTTSQATDELQLEAQPIKRDQQVLVRVRFSSDILALVTGANAIGNLVNMLVYTTSARFGVEDYWLPKVYGDSVMPLLKVLREQEKNIWDLAGEILTFDQRGELKKAIANSREKSKHTKGEIGSFASLSLVNDIIKSSAQTKSSFMPSSVFKLLDIDPLSGLDPATRELTETRLFGERAMFIVQHMPQLLEWQMELLVERTTKNQEVQQMVSNTTKIAIAGDRLSRTFEQMPSLISNEREKILAALKSEQQGLAELSKQVGLTMGEGSKMADATEKALKTFAGIVDQLDRSSSEPSSSEPFHIRDYAETALQIDVMMQHTTQLLSMLGPNFEPANIAKLSGLIDKITLQTQQRSQMVVEYAFQKAVLWVIISSLVLSLSLLAAGLLYKFLSFKIVSAAEHLK